MIDQPPHLSSVTSLSMALSDSTATTASVITTTVLVESLGTVLQTVATITLATRSSTLDAVSSTESQSPSSPTTSVDISTSSTRSSTRLRSTQATTSSSSLSDPSVSASAPQSSTSIQSSDAAQASVTSSPISSTNNQGLSTAALVGAAIACFIGGAFLAGIIACMFFRKRSKREKYVSRGAYVRPAAPAYGGEKGTPMVSISSVGSFEFLPQQADDMEVQRRLSTVLDQIDQHVETFYSKSIVPLNSGLEAELSRFETSQLSQPIAACFAHASDPTVLIRHCLTFHIFNLTVAPGQGTQPLLPPDIAGMVAAVYNKSLSSKSSKDMLTAFSTWKSLTKYLRPELDHDAAITRTTSENSVRIAAHFTNVFSPWANTQFVQDFRNRHLTDLVNDAIRTAVWLFGQADNYRFDWESPRARESSENCIVTVPAVLKMTYNGIRLGGPGQRILKPVVQRF